MFKYRTNISLKNFTYDKIYIVFLYSRSMFLFNKILLYLIDNIFLFRNILLWKIEDVK